MMTIPNSDGSKYFVSTFCFTSLCIALVTTPSACFKSPSWQRFRTFRHLTPMSGIHSIIFEHCLLLPSIDKLVRANDLEPLLATAAYYRTNLIPYKAMITSKRLFLESVFFLVNNQYFNFRN